MAAMNLADALFALQAHADVVRAMGATSLYVFGSTAQDGATAGSDLDLFIDYDPNGRFNAFDLIGIKLMLEERLGIDVDLATRDGLHTHLREEIEGSAVRVF